MGNVAGLLVVSALIAIEVHIVNFAGDVITFAFVHGCVLGVAQWSVIKRWVGINAWWIIFTGIGMLVGMIISRHVHNLPDDIQSFMWWLIVEGSSFGLAMGLLQWLVLRQRITSSKLWIVANIVGWGIAPLAGIFFVFPFVWGPPYGVFGAITGVIITGWAMVRMAENARMQQIKVLKNV
ncbi:MAG: hypothetical protein R6U89_01695 [Dehalococcoidia bacterium]